MWKIWVKTYLIITAKHSITLISFPGNKWILALETLLQRGQISYEIGFKFKVVYIFSRFELLADDSGDLSQTEETITVVKAITKLQIHKMRTIFTQNGNFWPFFERKQLSFCEFVQLREKIVFFSGWDKSLDSSVNYSKFEQIQWVFVLYEL
jgi:hypothetical protein